MASFTVSKIQCVKCGKTWNGAFSDYSLKVRKILMLALCKKCGEALLKEMKYTSHYKEFLSKE